MHPDSGCWRFMGTPAQNGVVTMGNNETMPLLPDSLLCEFTKPSESRRGETNYAQEMHSCESNSGATRWAGLIRFALLDMHNLLGRKRACHVVSNLVVQIR